VETNFLIRRSVNPLSMLTPGILRRIFEGRIPTATPAPGKSTPATLFNDRPYDELRNTLTSI